ncbi:hypothetical protein DENSPDRAFT_933649 [Dentipellis sp. KUC8613]|nr:hypothetical protein DENSPDRAFT_933649 [Dentipellis sp. KUC8613]
MSLPDIITGASTHVNEKVIDIIFNALRKPFPSYQIKTGDLYLDRALYITEQYRKILSNKERQKIMEWYDAAVLIKEESGEFKSFSLSTFGKSREYKRTARLAYETAEKLSRLSRIGNAFAEQDTVCETRAKDDDEIHLRLLLKVVSALRRPGSEGSEPNPFRSSAEDTETIAEASCEAPDLANAIAWRIRD